MSSLNDLKQRLSSVSQTRQITNAMYLLSVSRLKKSVLGIEHNLRYMQGLRGIMGDLIRVAGANGICTSYFRKREGGAPVYLAVMGDKGLCGDYNASLAALCAEKLAENENAKLFCLGLAGKEKLKSKGVIPDEALPGSSMHPTRELAQQLSERLLSCFDGGEAGEVYIIYTPYTKGERKPVCFRLLPFLPGDFTDAAQPKEAGEILFEPSAEETLSRFIPLYCSGLIYEMLVQSAACENASRMEAMQSATDNADEMIKKLGAQLNAERQLAITNEITEIAAAANIKGI